MCRGDKAFSSVSRLEAVDEVVDQGATLGGTTIELVDGLLHDPRFLATCEQSGVDLLDRLADDGRHVDLRDVSAEHFELLLELPLGDGVHGLVLCFPGHRLAGFHPAVVGGLVREALEALGQDVEHVPVFSLIDCSRYY